MIEFIVQLLMSVLGVFIFVFFIFLFVESFISFKTGKLIFRLAPWWTWNENCDEKTNRRIAVYQMVGSLLILILLVIMFSNYSWSSDPFRIWNGEKCIFNCLGI